MPEVTTREPYIRIVRGDATAEEVAALVAVLASLPEAKAAQSEPGNWRNPASRMRRPLPHGPDAWRRAFSPAR